MKKKFFSFLTTIFMVLALFCGSFFAVKGNIVAVDADLQEDAAVVNPGGGGGTSGNWYDYAKVESAGFATGYAWNGNAYVENGYLYVEIASANDLAFFMRAVNDNRNFFSRTHSSYDWYYTQTSYKYRQARQVTLLADISMSAHYWTQIGTNSYKFEGDFDGKGHTISGLSYSKGYSSSTTLYYGLFGAVKGSIIQDLCIDVDFSVNNAVNNGMTLYMGALAGYCENATIRHCSVNGELNVSGSSCNESYLGGLIGYAKNTKVRDSNSYLENLHVGEAGNFYIGGIIGRAVDGGEVDDVSNFGKMNQFLHINADTKAIGGIVGGITGTTKYKIADVVNYLSISTSSGSKTSRHIGGILGYGENNVAINRCVNYGNISGSTNKEYIGGIVGRLGHNQELVWGWAWETHANWEKNYVTNCITYGSVSGAGNNKIGYSVGSFKGELRGNYVLGVFGSYITTAGELLNKPSDWDTGKYIRYRNGSQYRTAEFFTERSSYNEGGIHEFDFNGNFDNYSVYVEGWYSHHDDGTYEGRWEPNVSTDEAYTVYTWAYTPLVYNYYRSKNITTSNFSTNCALARKYGMNYFRVNFKYKIPEEDEAKNLNNSDLAKVTSKGYVPNTYGDIYYFDGAKYGNAYYYGSPYLCDVYYDTNEFTWKATTSDKIGLGSTSGTNFDFKNLISPVGAGSYSWSNGSYEQTYVGTITYYLEAKPHTVTFKYVDEDGNSISGCSTTRSTTFYYGQAYGNLSTVTPAMGYYLTYITANDGSTIYANVYGDYGVQTIGTSWIYRSAVTTITFNFNKIDYYISAEFTGDDADASTCYSKHWKIGDNSINVLSDLGYKYTITKLKVDQEEYNIGPGVVVKNNGLSVEGKTGSSSRGSVIEVNTTNLIYGSYKAISLKETSLILVINRTKINYNLTAKVLVERSMYTDGRGGNISLTHKGTTLKTETSGGQFTKSVQKGDSLLMNVSIKKGYESELWANYGELNLIITYYAGEPQVTSWQLITSVDELFRQSYYEIKNIQWELRLDVGMYSVLDSATGFDLSRCVNLIPVTETTNGTSTTKYYAKYFAEVQVTLSDAKENSFIVADEKIITLERSYKFICDPNISANIKSMTAVPIDYAKFNEIAALTSSRPTIERNIYHISNYQQLAWLSANNDDLGGFEGCIVRLENDIDIPYSDKFNFMPIGDKAHPFRGVFDGQNHVIRGLHFSQKQSAYIDDRIDTKRHVGLFGAASGATIKDLTISGAKFSGYSNVGIFAGYAENSTFTNLNAYQCELKIQNVVFGDIYGNIVVSANTKYSGAPSNVSVNGQQVNIQYGDPSSTGRTIELKGKNCVSLVSSEYRSKIGGIVGEANGCTFRGVSYNEGEIINKTTETGVTCYAFAGAANSSTEIDQCFAYGAKTSIQTDVFSNGGTLTDYYLRKGSNNVEGQYEKNNINNWIVVGGKEVLKIFYWHW